jgi:hypothetical protein
MHCCSRAEIEIDPPPPDQPNACEGRGVTPPDRWSYIKGSSRRHLPKLLSQLSEIDLFIHDSLHSERNVRFEIDRAWVALSQKGALVVDDIDANWGFHSFTQTFPGHKSLICEAEPLHLCCNSPKGR